MNPTVRILPDIAAPTGGGFLGNPNRVRRGLLWRYSVQKPGADILRG